MRCWRDLPTLRDATRFNGWLHRLLMHAITDELRSGRRHQSNVRVLRLEPSVADSSGDIAVREQLRRGFDQISPEHRAVVVLRLYLGLSIDETAAAAGIPIGTAKSRLHYALQAMRRAIEADGSATPGEVPS